MHQDLVELVDMALMDGELSIKQREIILRKADKLGEDPDEVEIWLEGKIAIAKRNKPQEPKGPEPPPLVSPSSSLNAVHQQSKSGFEVKKCPSCKAEIQSFTSKCPYCGYEIRTDESNMTINKLFEKLEEIDTRADERDSKASDREGNTSALSMLGKNFANEMFNKSKSGGDSRQERKIQAITTFPVPNTKEAIIEFVALAIPNTKLGWTDKLDPEKKDLAKAWKSKLEQIIIKSKIMFKDDQVMLKEILQYEKQIK